MERDGLGGPETEIPRARARLPKWVCLLHSTAGDEGRCPMCPEMFAQEPGTIEFVPDPVDHPPHYNQGSLECIEAIRSALGEDGFEFYCRGNALKYLWRARYKGKHGEDLKKAIWYVERAAGANWEDGE